MDDIAMRIRAAINGSRAILRAIMAHRATWPQPIHHDDPAGPLEHRPERCNGCTTPPGFPGDDRPASSIRTAIEAGCDPRAIRGVGLGCGGKSMARWCRAKDVRNPGCRAWCGLPCPVLIAEEGGEEGERALEDARREARRSIRPGDRLAPIRDR